MINVRANSIGLCLLLACGVASAGDATQCVSVQDKQIHNNCNGTISVVWCVLGDGSNCSRGLDNQSDISPGGSTPANPGGNVNAGISVQYAACSGSMTAVAIGMRHKCD